MINDVGIVLTCHKGLLEENKDYVLRAIKSVRNQSVVPKEKVFICDCPIPREIIEELTDWIVIVDENSKQVEKKRNIGTLAIKANWIAYLDADNYYPQKFFENVLLKIKNTKHTCNKIGVYFVNLLAIDNPNHIIVKTFSNDISELLIKNFVDTASIWNKFAVLQAGGWSIPTSLLIHNFHYDWLLAYKLKLLGYDFCFIDLHINYQLRENSLGKQINAYYKNSNHTLLDLNGITVLTIFSGKEYCLQHWMDVFSKIVWPRNTKFWWHIAAPDPGFSQQIKKYAYLLPYPITITHSDLIRSDLSLFSSEEINKISSLLGIDVGLIFKNCFSSGLYNEILQKINTPYVMFYEDDIIPINPETIVTDLFNVFIEKNDCVGVGAVYFVINNDVPVVSGMKKFRKNEFVLEEIDTTFEDLMKKENLIETYSVSGFSIYKNGILKKLLPITSLQIITEDNKNYIYSWPVDNSIGYLIHKYCLGKLYLNKKCVCNHYLSPDKYVEGKTGKIINLQLRVQ